MSLSAYHQKVANHPEDEVARRQKAKRDELEIVFNQIKPETDSEILRVAVLGCADKRYVKSHKAIFQELLGKPVELTTFDLTTDHLEDAEGVIQHDCTLPLPNPPYDVTFSHVLLRFIETDKQWNLLKNSYDALKPGGIALHILELEDIDRAEVRLENGLYSVPLKRWLERLDQEKIEYKIIDTEFELAGLDLPRQKSRALVLMNCAGTL